MKRFKNILVVYNDVLGADDALTQATSMALCNGASLTLVDVCPFGEPSRNLVAEREKRLRRTARSLQLEGVESTDAVVLVGDGAEEVIGQVRRRGHDMVIASSDGGTALQNAIYGTMATTLMRKCPAPVWIVKPGQSDGYRRVLAAVDLDPHGSTIDPLSAKVVEMASSFASSQGAALHVLHAWEVTGKDADTLYSEIPDATRKGLLERNEAARRQALDELLRNHIAGNVIPLVHLPRGAPVWEIPGAVDAHAIDLVVMGIANRSGFAGLILGNAAERILTAAARCAVMAVKPIGLEDLPASSVSARSVA